MVAHAWSLILFSAFYFGRCNSIYCCKSCRDLDYCCSMSSLEVRVSCLKYR